MDEELQPLETPVKQKQKKKISLGKLAVVAAVFSLCAWSVVPFLSSDADKLSQSDRSQITQGMQNISAVPVQTVTEQEWDQALETIPLDVNSKAQLVESLSRPDGQQEKESITGESKLILEDYRLVWIDLWDFATQDGDIVNVSSAGYSIQVNLLNAPSRIAIPVDASRLVNLTGLVDGGGGITLGVNAASAQQLIIEPGSSFMLPVSY